MIIIVVFLLGFFPTSKSSYIFFHDLTVWAFNLSESKINFKPKIKKTLLGTSYTAVYGMTMCNTHIQGNDVAFVLWALVQPYTMIFL